MSGIFKLNLADLLRGLITAVLTASLTAMQQFFSTTGTITPINWKLVGGVAAATAIGYLLKNLLTDNTGKVMGIAATAGPPQSHEENTNTVTIGPNEYKAILDTPPPAQGAVPQKTPEQLLADYKERLRQERANG
jgi:hypothetical protein